MMKYSAGKYRVAASITVAALALALSACGSRVGENTDTLAKSCLDTGSSEIKIGSLNSLSGTMAISEVSVRDAIKLAVDEINAAGGVLGKRIEIVAEDGASNPAVFAEKAEKLIKSDCVAATFGGWTSTSRKAMLPVFERNNSLLYYPVQYEGLEASRNIFYAGATTNQQVIPALDYLRETKAVKSLYLVGSDSVFSHTSSRIIRAYAAQYGITVTGEDYTAFGANDFTTIVNKIKSSGTDAVISMINGDSNVAFYREYKNNGLVPETTPVVSTSIAEEEVKGIGSEYLAGQFTAWNYFQTINTPENKKFVAAWKNAYGEDRPTSDPVESAYTSVYLWKNTVEKAKSFLVNDVLGAAEGVSFAAPGGEVSVNGENHHVTKTAVVGVVRDDGLIYPVWTTNTPVQPDPFLKTYPWAKSLGQ
ncbi:urea ABC transporter substrate-binding protein [Arthrobacter sp. AB6]|uniref:urea ABC transporter substrate-binding protein n=1 Tax=Arthrobacter sp. AB6 TaxID=2962570 RepID=UPI0028820E14|nr:urea ABC transporter substrate-binding protein [Arthrobacter sp. AB6]MDT0196693.1 urea ABC transporter substrate-binding protein [Arthrobacter sp. AB6]